MKISVLLLLFAAGCVAGFSQPILPDNDVGKRAAALISMVNSTGDEPLAAFITEHMSSNPDLTLAQRVERFRSIRGNLKNAKVVKVIRFDSSAIEFVVSLPDGSGRMIRLETANDGKNLIAGFTLDDVADEPQADSRLLTEDELLPHVEKYLDKLSRDDRFSGAVVIARNGRPIFSKAYGEADKEKKIANSLSTKFNIGSENKVFTTLAIGMLADEGAISLDDVVGKHLPNYPNQDAARKVTIRHLLSMSSGIGDFFGPEFDRSPKEKLQTINDYLPLFAAKPLQFEPGTKRQYSNGGFIVLGSIIEKVTGKSYYDFVRDRIFKPLGMHDTDSYLRDDNAANLAMGYIGRGKERRPNIETLPARGSSAGGGYSTVGDMLKFVNAFESGKISVPRSLASDPSIGRLFQGFGVAGGSPGVNASLDSKVAGSYTIIVMSNYDPPSAEDVSRQIRAWLGSRN